MTAYLADACAIIGFLKPTPGFPAALRSLIADHPDEVAVAATTVWEIAIKTSRGKLADLRAAGFATLTDMLAAAGHVMLPLDHVTAEQAASLPPLHNDPFDRALVAVAQRTGRTVLTSDRIIGQYGVPTRW